MITAKTPASPGSSAAQHEPRGRGGLRRRLLAQLGVAIGACLLAVAIDGRFSSRLVDAGVAAGIALVAGVAWLLRPGAATEGDAAPAHFGQTKKILVLLMLIGVVAYVGGRSTWSSFSAETANPGGSLASGTLLLSNDVNDSVTACASTDAVSADNYNAGCDIVLAPTNLAPGSQLSIGSAVPPTAPANGQESGFYSKVTIKNTGSLDAARFSVYGAYVNGALSTPITSGDSIGTGQTVTGFDVSSLRGPVASGDQIVLSYGGVSQTFCASGNVSPSTTTTSIPISGIPTGSPTPTCASPATTTAATTFQNGTRLQDTSSDTTTTNMNCWDENTAGNVFNFNSPSGNPLCRAALLWVQEQTGGFNYCWFGRGSPADTGNGATEDANGQCRTPTTMTLGTNVSSGSSSYSLDVGTLTGNIRAQDTIVLSESNTTTTCTYASGAGGAAANYYIGSSSTISVSNCTTSGSPVTFDSSALVYDKSAFDALNPSATNTYNTISSLDTAHGQGNPIYLTPVTGNHTTDTNAAVQLSRQGGSLDTRTFYIGVYLPSSTGSGQNSLQGIQSTFGIGWHIDQQ